MVWWLAVPLGLSIASGVILVDVLLFAGGQEKTVPLLLALLALGGAIAQVFFLQWLLLWRTQRALGEAEAKFATIFRTSPDPVAILTLAEGRLLEVNDRLVEFVGYSRAELIGRTTLELNLWQEPAARQSYLALIHHWGQVRNLEVQVRTQIGTVKTGLLSAEVQVLEGQTCVIAVLCDISERKYSEAQRQQVEAALRASETLLRQLAEAVKEGFFVYDVDADEYAYVNSAHWQIRGTDPNYGSGTKAQWLASIHADDRDRIVAALARERQGEPFDEEYRYTTPDGELRWLHSKAFPLLDDGGNVVRVVGTVENITDRKRTEAALRQSEARFRSAFDDAPYGISLVDTTGKFVQANAYCCALLGYSEAELLTLTFQDITHPADRADDWATFQRMMAGEPSASEIKKRYITKQGEVIPVVISAAPIHNEAGQPLYCVGHVQDLRDRIAIDRMKDEFISVVSHELRTPITAIQGALALLGAGVYAGRPAKARHMLEIAINNSDRLVRLVDDILSFERLESGQVQLEKERCQVDHLLYQAIDSVQPLADQSGITIALTPLTAILWAAPDGVIQVLTNLLSNAIKFSSPGGTVWLRAEIISQMSESSCQATELVENSKFKIQNSNRVLPTPHLLLTVRDHGRGIPADKLETIFEQFQQVDVSDSRQRGGTGLGLAICKRIVQQHRGRIWAESVVGEGSTFFVALPLTENSDD